jgi:hypothetical protein
MAGRHPSGRASQASPQAPTGLGHSVTIPDAREIANHLLGRADSRTAAPAKIDALMCFEEGRTLFRPTVYMRHKNYAWLRDNGLIEGDTDSCLLTPLGARVQLHLGRPR